MCGAGLRSSPWNASRAGRHGLTQQARNFPCLYPRGKIARRIGRETSKGRSRTSWARCLSGKNPGQIAPVHDGSITPLAGGKPGRSRGVLPQQLRDREEERIQ